MIAVVISPVALIVVLIVLVIVASGPRAYGYYRPAYVGPHLDWVWALVLIVVILWLLGYL